MRVEIRIEGHQLFRCIVGEVLHCGSGVEKFESRQMEVPCITVKTDDGIVLPVNLQRHLQWITVRVLDAADATQDQRAG